MYTFFSSFQLKVKIDKITQQSGGSKHYALFMKQELLFNSILQKERKYFIDTLKFGLPLERLISNKIFISKYLTIRCFIENFTEECNIII